MKKAALGIIAIATLIGTPAVAADMLVKAPPLAAPYIWTGCYAGGNIGYSWGNANSNYDELFPFLGLPDPISGTQRLDGIIGGGQIGCNWQANKTWVLGLEADIQGSAERGGSSFSDPFTVVTNGDPILTGTFNTDIQWFGTVRGRIGLLATPTLLFYGTGGLAYGGISVSGTDNIGTLMLPSFGASAINVGWTVGVGVEGAIPNTSNWTWKVEYLYIDFGTLSGSGYDPVFAKPYSWSTSVTDNILRVGFNYRFY
jgi:outer membrane immunogenic protein